MSLTTSASIVICAHSDERLPLLRGALQSAFYQQGGPHEVIAVIDHNSALLASIASEFPSARVVGNARARGLSGARNTGVDAATGEVIAFLDDDALAAPDWIERILAHYEDPRVMGVGGRVDAIWPDGRPDWFAPEFDWVVGCSYRGLPTTSTPVRNLIGCNMSFRRGIFSVAGLFREGQGRDGDNGAGCEETDLCIRAGAAFPGSSIVYDPAIAVRHILSPKRTTWAYFVRRCLAEGRSKAQLTGTLGSQRGLASERQHVTRVLPSGVLRGIGDGLRWDLSGIKRAFAIVGGTACVGAGYVGALRRRSAPAVTNEAGFAPIRIAEIDIDQPLEPIPAFDPRSGQRFGGAFCAVRSGGQLLRIVEFPLYGEDIPSTRLTQLLGGRPEARAAPAVAVAAAQDMFARVIVATRDRPQALIKCLDSLLTQSHRNHEILVVDNCSSGPDTRDLIASRYVDTGRVFYRREDRAGLGHAHNLGVSGSIAEVLAFTDDDVLVDHSWLAALVGNFAGSDRVGCVTGLILPAELETRAQLWTERHGGFGKGLERRVFDLDEHRPSGRLFPFAAGSFGSGANMAFSRRALVGVGGFDGALGAGTLARGGDDLAAFVSVIKAGYQLVYEPQAIVWHHHRRGEDGMQRQAYGYGVGLGAYLTKFIVDEPTTVLHYVQALPAGLAHMLSGSSSKNAKLPVDYPKALRWSERMGVFAGMPAYLRSRASLRRYQRDLGLKGTHRS